MKKFIYMKNSEEAVSPVIGVILMVAITVILAAVIGSYVFGIGPPKQAPEIYFSSVEAYTDGNVSATVSGGGGATLGSLKWLVQDTEIATTNIYINEVQGDDSASISAGDRLVLVTNSGTAGTWAVGQELRITIADRATGDLLLDVTVRVRST